MQLVWITLGLNLSCVLIGLVLSILHLYTPWFSNFQIQERKEKTKVFWQRLPLIAFNLSILQIVSGLGIYFGQGMFAMEWQLWFFLVQFLLMLFVDDLFFYGFHRLLHENEFLFRHIHRIHHKASTPFALEFIYVHPLEWMGGSMGVLLGLGLVYGLFGSVNVYAFWAYAFFRSAHEVEIHSGLNFKFLSWIFPFYGSAKQHDEHHAFVRGNYASSLNYLDRIFGTSFKK